MGRQVGLYITESDYHAFVDMLRLAGRDVRFALVCSDQPDLQAVDAPSGPGVWCFWDQSLSDRVARRIVPQAPKPYYRVNDFEGPVLELSLRETCQWDDRPALAQGRVYLGDPSSFPDVTTWYVSIARWIRRTYRPNPWRYFGGYVGPDAWRWHQDVGGIFLGSHRPPETPDWRAVIAHPERLSWEREDG